MRGYVHDDDLYGALYAAQNLVTNLQSIIVLKVAVGDAPGFRRSVSDDFHKLAEALGYDVEKRPTPSASDRVTNSLPSESGLSADDRADMERDDRMNERAA